MAAGHLMKQLILCCMAVALGGCAQQVPANLLAPTDPTQGLRASRATSLTSDARHYQIEEPLDWDSVNRRVAPKESK